jgi:Holliday junction resolvasome RuvABC endonuclease subunit
VIPRIVFPKFSSHVATIIGIDPGTRFMGVATLEYDLRDFSIVRSSTRTLVAARMALDPEMVYCHSEKFARLHALEQELLATFRLTEPIDVYCESPYYSGKTPSAFGPLIETVQTVRRAVQRYDRGMALTTITPSAIKSAIGASGGAKKGPVLDAMTAMCASICYDSDLGLVDNNAVDALAIAVTGYKLAAGLI